MFVKNDLKCANEIIKLNIKWEERGQAPIICLEILANRNAYSADEHIGGKEVNGGLVIGSCRGARKLWILAL